MTIPKAFSLDGNKLHELHTVDINKTALDNIEINGEAGTLISIGSVPLGSTESKQVSSIDPIGTLSGEFPIGFSTNRIFYPRHIVDVASTDTSYTAEQRYYLISGSRKLFHLESSNNRLSLCSDITGDPSVYEGGGTHFVDDASGAVFQDPELVNIAYDATSRGCVVFLSNGEAWGQTDISSGHVWTKFTTQHETSTRMMAEPSAWIPISGGYTGGYYFGWFVHKRTGEALSLRTQTAISTSTLTATPYATALKPWSIFNDIANSGASNSGCHLMFQAEGTSRNLLASTHPYLPAATYPTLRTGFNHEKIRDEDLRVIGLGRNTAIDVTYTYYMVLSDGSVHTAHSVSTNQSYGKEFLPALPIADATHVISSFRGGPIFEINLPLLTNDHFKFRSVNASLHGQMTLSPGIPQIDLTLPPDGYSALRGILLDGGEKLQIYSDKPVHVTVPKSETAA